MNASRIDEILPALSPRQLEILLQLTSGRTHRNIAERLGISRATVDRHVADIYIKLRVSSRARALARARELGWLNDDAAR